MKNHYPSDDEWRAEGVRRFGHDMLKWKFICPSCGFVASVDDWKKVGALPGEVAFSCVGRHLPHARSIFGMPGPCNYTGGGLFGLNPVKVTGDDGVTTAVFAFAEPDEKAVVR